jgi:hypothetical protein
MMTVIDMQSNLITYSFFSPRLMRSLLCARPHDLVILILETDGVPLGHPGPSPFGGCR